MRRTALLAAVVTLACGPQPDPRPGQDVDAFEEEDGGGADARPGGEPARAGQDAPAVWADAAVAVTPDAATPDAAPDAAAREAPAPAADAAASDAAAAGCPFRLCEDFESAPAGMAPDPKLWTRTGDIVVEAAPGGRASRALRVRAGHTPTETYIAQTATLPALGEAFYGRVRLYIASRPTDFFHWSFTEVRGPDVRGTSVRYGGISVGCERPGVFCRNSFLFQTKPLVYGPDEGATADDDLDLVVTEKTWHCVEWYMNARTRETRLWWNGQERPKMHYQDGKGIPFPAFTRLYLGWALYQTGASGVNWEVWFDDLAVHSDRVGCGP